jgi:ribosomal protein S18 acetylase RimI-like enzyme
LRDPKRGVELQQEPCGVGLCAVQERHNFATTQAEHPVRCSRYNGRVSFRIRKFEEADFETIWQIDQICFDPLLAYSRQEMAFYISSPKSFTLVAEGDGNAGLPSQSAGATNQNILGFIVTETRRKTGHIITIDVIADARRLGVGSALLQAAEEQLVRAGATVVALETPIDNNAAIRFYKEKQFVVEKTKAGYYANGLDALMMTKRLGEGTGS